LHEEGSLISRFLITITQRHLEYDRMYEEWMFTCKVSSVATPFTRTKEFFYYVSRGSKPHTVFLYWQKFPDDRLFVDNYMKNVGVVDASSFDCDTSASESHLEGGYGHTISHIFFLIFRLIIKRSQFPLNL